jgi:hypothetical protein
MDKPALPPLTRSTHRLPGRPPSNLMKVTITVRIPADVDHFLTEHANEQGMFKGDIIADAVIEHFRLRKHAPVAAGAAASQR